MPTEVLQLYSASAVTSAGVTYIDVPYPGKIVAANIDIAGLGGAGTTGVMRATVSRQGVDAGSVNNAKGEIYGATCTFAINAGVANVNCSIAGVAVPVKTGERIYLNLAQSGVQPTSCSTRAQLHLLT